MNAYGIFRCGDELDEHDQPVAPLGPNGESCQRALRHPLPHTAAMPGYVGTVRWSR